ncbi:MAG TPA: hydrogenase expression/formation protein HypE [Desulfotomaculum sp.]|nr:MAG: carbamoyl dehydratase HypE [Peptococcaceae bacterium BRH_c8a]KJS75524.1 MAG: carbamoyl dehydratase HypE [Desulfotomaculum sp. BICA1-6]HBX23257.1 hydrogenase expression/formation protein HypE [Desulfotomaculum sp.]
MDNQEKKHDSVLLAHGDGGLLTAEMINQIFLKYFSNSVLEQLSDAAVFTVPEGRLALTTDSFVVAPVFFPGGDIGKLAVCGTVNDLAVSGAHPLYLAASFIIEEGFPLADLERVASSMADACREARVAVATGDTKVVPRGQADGIFITTTGVGVLANETDLGPHRMEPGDVVIVNGNLGDHGLAILSARETLGLEGLITSDCAPLNRLIGLLLEQCPGVKMMRDLTRGGLATAAKEIARAGGRDIFLSEERLPVHAAVRGGTEMLGLDPLYLANEGKFMAIVDPGQAGHAINLLRQHPYGLNAAVVGEVRNGEGQLYLETALGGTRILDLLAGSPLPRIC